MTVATLPDTPGVLVRHALADLRRCEADNRYRVAMRFWHVPHWYDSEVCLVCLVGSVMAKSLDADPLCSYTPDDFYERRKLYALDRFRVGDVAGGLSRMDRDNLGASRISVPAYHRGPDAFKDTMWRLAEKLDRAASGILQSP